jgi:hypothetical protein
MAEKLTARTRTRTRSTRSLIKANLGLVSEYRHQITQDII